MIWCIVGLISGIIILIAAFWQKKNMPRISDISANAYRIIMGVLTVVFIFLLTFKVTEIPVPYNVDEAGMAYDAQNIANYHCDRYLYRFPVLFRNYGGGGMSALYPYMAVVFIKLFGYSYFTVRLPAIFLSLLSALLFSLSVRKTHGNLTSVCMMILFCILPFSIMHSRWGLDCYLMFPMLMISVTVFYHTVITGKTRWFLLSGFLFGLTLYTYSISYLAIPFFLGILLVYLLIIGKVTWKNVIAMGIPLFLFAIPLMLMLMINYGYMDEIRTRYFSIPKLQEFRGGEISFHNILNNLRFDKHNIFYNMFVNDGHLYNVIPEFGTFYYVSIPIIIFGLILSVKKTVRAIKQQEICFDMMMVALFLVLILISLTFVEINVNRVNGIYISLIFFLAVGVSEIVKRRKTAGIICGAVYIVCFGAFLNYYFNDFSEDLKSDILFTSIEEFNDALTFADSVSAPDETIYILDSSWSYVYVLLSRNIDPYTFNEIKVLSYDDYIKLIGNYRFRLDAIMPDKVYMFITDAVVPENIGDYGFSMKRFGGLSVYYPGAASDGGIQ